jgi:hypothetical protein
MKRLNLLLAILLAICTTAVIILFFFTISYSKEAAGLVTLISMLGYLGSALYFHNYKQIKNDKEIL